MTVAARATRRSAFGAVLPARSWLPTGLLLAVTIPPLVSVHLAGWAPGTEVTFSVGALGILTALWLSRTRLSSRWIIAIGAFLDLAVAYIVASEAFPGPVDGIGNFAELFGGTVEWVQLRQAGEFAGEQPLGAAVNETWQLFVDLYFRVESWFASALALEVSRDNVIFLFWMTLAAWAMGFVASWATFRIRSVVLAALPGTLAIGINITYIGADLIPFALFLFGALGLAVYLRWAVLERKWDASSTDYSRDLGSGVLTASVAVISLVVLISIALPRAASNPLAEVFWTYLGDSWGSVEAGVQRLFGGVSNPSGAGFTGRETLALSGSQPLGRQGTLFIQSTSAGYWRGQTFDIYTGQGWRSSYRQLAEREPNALVNPELELRSRIVARTNVEILNSNSSVLYAPGDPLRLNRRYLVQVDDADAEIQDFASIRATRRVGQRLQYSVDSSVSGATDDQLRTAPSDYPPWIGRYLELPELPDRVHAFGARMREVGETPFDRALAIEFFLRRLPFDANAPNVPPEQDSVDFLLFEIRRGHSALVASAMAVLLRDIGIPSRLVTGYSFGTFDERSERFIVTAEDAHTWVEAYFPTYGWIVFEPSGFSAPVARGEGDGEGAEGPGQLGTGAVDFTLEEIQEILGGLVEDQFQDFSPLQPEQPNPIGEFFARISGALMAIAALIGVIVLLALGGIAYGLLRDRLRNPTDAVRHSYRRMVRYAKLAGYNAGHAQTPWEFGRDLSAELFSAGELTDQRAATSSALRVDGAPPPETVAAAYMRAMYSHHAITHRERATVDRAWKHVRRRLVRRMVRMPTRRSQARAV